MAADEVDHDFPKQRADANPAHRDPKDTPTYLSYPAGMFGADAPAFETYRKGAGVERIECRHAINNDEPVNVELQLHQQLFAEGVDEVGGVGSASHMADLDPRA